MSSILQYVIIFLYLSVSTAIMLYGLHCYVMIFLFARRHKQERLKIEEQIANFYQDKSQQLPFVTVQLPIYNEAEVITRLLQSAAALDYPKDKFEIQVLDDSNDDTCDLVDDRCKELQNIGISAYPIRRDNRENFKAGA